jgi:CRP/FNR family transcriptional regulator, cyclic AMP receptor protein
VRLRSPAGRRRPFPVTASYVFVPGCEVNALTSYGALLTFFDYPGTQGATTAEQAPDVFLPEASDSDWSVLLRRCRRRQFDVGEAVITAGATSRSLYLVVDGTLEVRPQGPGRLTGRSRPVITVGAGSVLGEMSFFDSGQRSALVRATTPVELAELRLDDFDALAEEDPRLGLQILFDLGRILAQRLRRAQGSG